MSKNSQIDELMQKRTKAVAEIIKVFGAQHKLGSAIGSHQSTIALWHTKGDIPSRNHKKIMEVSKDLFEKGEVTRVVTLRDFIDLPSGQVYRELVQHEGVTA